MMTGFLQLVIKEKSVRPGIAINQLRYKKGRFVYVLPQNF
jgi:hypothetical protein